MIQNEGNNFEYLKKFLIGRVTFYDKKIVTAHRNKITGNIDTIILEGSVYETKRWEANSTIKEKSTVKIYETFGNIFVNQKIDTFYFLMGGSYKNLDLNIGLQIDSSNRATSDKKSGIIYNQNFLNNTLKNHVFTARLGVGYQPQWWDKKYGTLSINLSSSCTILSAIV